MILVPRISEKAVGSAEEGIYVFEVPTSANKIEIEKALKEQFKVDAISVNTMILKGKTKRFQKQLGRQKDTKKAVVRLKKGQTIALFEGAK